MQTPSWALPAKRQANLIISALFDKLHFPANVAVGLIKDGNKTSFGFSSEGRPPTGDSIFMIGSVQKVFGGVLFAYLDQKNFVNVNDTVSMYIPSNADVANITLRELATFTSGLPANDAVFDKKIYAAYSPGEVGNIITNYLSSCQLVSSPGSAYLYSDISAPLLPYLLSTKMKQSYASLSSSLIFEPLRMYSSGMGFPSKLVPRLVRGYSSTTGMIGTDPTDNQLSATGDPQMHSTVHDLLKFTEACLDAPHLSDMLSKSIQQTQRSYYPVQKDITTGYFWSIYHDTTYVKNGASNYYGYAAILMYDTVKNCGVVILSNTTSISDIEQMGWKLLGLLDS